MAGGEGLRRGEGEQADGDAADGRPREAGQAAFLEAALDQSHEAHDADGDEAEQDSEQQIGHIVGGLDMERAGDRNRMRRHAEAAGRQIAAERRRHHRCDGRDRIDADDQLEPVERAGQRRAEGGGDRRCRAAADDEAQIGAAQAEPHADRRGDAARHLRIAGLEADGGAEAVGDDVLQPDAQAVLQRHASAMQRIGLDRVDDRRAACGRCRG